MKLYKILLVTISTLGFYTSVLASSFIAFSYSMKAKISEIRCHCSLSIFNCEVSSLEEILGENLADIYKLAFTNNDIHCHNTNEPQCEHNSSGQLVMKKQGDVDGVEFSFSDDGKELDLSCADDFIQYESDMNINDYSTTSYIVLAQNGHNSERPMLYHSGLYNNDSEYQETILNPSTSKAMYEYYKDHDDYALNFGDPNPSILCVK